MSSNASGGVDTRQGNSLKHTKTSHTKKTHLSKGSYGKVKPGYAHRTASETTTAGGGNYSKPGLNISKRSFGKPVHYLRGGMPWWVWLITAVVVIGIVLAIAL